MTSLLPAARLTLRALLLSSLLVFGQGLVLALTSSNPPLAPSKSNHKAVQSLSSLTFLTLLWLGSTALEHAEAIILSANSSSSGSERKPLLEAEIRSNTTVQRTEEVADGFCSILCRKDVELGVGLLLTTAWIVYRSDQVESVDGLDSALEGGCLRVVYSRPPLRIKSCLSQDTVRPDTCYALVTRGAPSRIPAVERREASLALTGRS
ncbi:hypothetical protein EHS25_007271 [Saitozyma podzolica]|uniref:Uncharacterized protein n=1 Tax=Saitozyma podzolica TaxID=1890683 RepID=A0A427XMT1_9TREE|nr:hypothetical protein EHS25_007271 [Saitozyma podzolica]